MTYRTSQRIMNVSVLTRADSHKHENTFSNDRNKYKHKRTTQKIQAQ
jgi:hypothetical protein